MWLLYRNCRYAFRFVHAPQALFFVKLLQYLDKTIVRLKVCPISRRCYNNFGQHMKK